MGVVRPPAYTEDDLGPAGWRHLHELAKQRNRPPRDQILPLLQWAIAESLAGEDVEPRRQHLRALQGDRELEVA